MKPTKNPLTACIGTLTLAALLCASCSGDILPGEDTGKRPALLQLQSLQASGMGGPATRAAATSDYPTGRFIGFFAKEDELAGYTACDNYKGAYDATGAKWFPTPEILLNTQNADIAVYAPYDITQTASAALGLTACLRPADGSKDIWCKRFTANNLNASVALTLEHIYTRLVLNVSRGTDYKVDATLTDLALTGNEIYAGATYKFFETSPYVYDGPQGFSALSTQVLDASTATATYDMLLIPTATLTGDINLAFTVNGKKMQTLIAKEKFSATSQKLEAGKQYNINLKLIPGHLEITSVTVVKWDVLAELDGGSAEYEPDIELTPDGSQSSDYETDGTDISNDNPKEI